MDFERLEPALGRLHALIDDDDDLVGYLRAVTHFVLLEVPACVGVSITLMAEGVPYTVTATDPGLRAVDGVQYVADGPCVTTAGEGSPTDVPDVLDEKRWHAYAEAAAAAGIRSSLSLPLLFQGENIGALNLYGGSPDAFDDRAHMLAELISGHAAYAITNADLSMRTAEAAAALEIALESASEPEPLVEQAVGVLMQLKNLQPDEARQQLRDAAVRAGIAPVRLAEAIVGLIAD